MAETARQHDLFAGSARIGMAEAMHLTLQSLQAYGPAHDHWGIAYSGGKDSTATLTVVLRLIDAGLLTPPRTLSVYYADTRQELPPLAATAERILQRLRDRGGITVEVVRAPLDKRFLVYILGRGVPPPNNTTLRWCTRQIKVDPMSAAIEARLADIDGSMLMITGVRQGESAMRDRRIEMSCGRDGAECGQGWYQQVLPSARGIRGRIATLAPLLHWRVCQVWDWLMVDAPDDGWPTRWVAHAYGGDEAAEHNARTGCIGCPLASRDTALDLVIGHRDWDHLAPLRGLKPLYRDLRRPEHRLRKPGGEARQDGSLAAHQNRMGPLTLEAREMGLARVLAIQAKINDRAAALGRPRLDILNAEETARIRDLIAAETWPNGWDGGEPRTDLPFDSWFADGSRQQLLVR